MGKGVLTDALYMIQAVDVAITGLNRNPPGYGSQVGSLLIAPDGTIISSAHNSIVGGERRHAEEIVLLRANGVDLSDATLYTTMEPCNGNIYHTRKHCCEQIGNAGVGKVVIGAEKWYFDGGADHLKDHGVEVSLIENERLNHLCDLLTDGSMRFRGLSHKIMTQIDYVRSHFSL